MAFLARALGICAAVALLGGFGTAVRAGTLPDVSGTWYANGNPAGRCTIDQSGTFVSLTDEHGARATAVFDNPSLLRADWGPFGGGEISGSISKDLRSITWSNGTYWTRSSGYKPATPGVVSANEPFPYRQILSAATSAPGHAPIEIFNGWGAVARDGTWAWVCLSFKNDSHATATHVRFDALLLDKAGEVLETLHLDRLGTFSPGVKINSWQSLQLWMSGLHRDYQDNCSGRRADSDETRIKFERVHAASFRVESAKFSDGSTWPKVLAAP